MSKKDSNMKGRVLITGLPFEPVKATALSLSRIKGVKMPGYTQINVGMGVGGQRHQGQ